MKLHGLDNESPQPPGTPQPIEQIHLAFAHPVAFPLVHPQGHEFEVLAMRWGGVQDTRD